MALGVLKGKAMANNQTNYSPPLLATVEEGCSMLRIGRTKLYELMADAQIESVLIGRARRPKVSSLKRFAERGTVDGTN